HWKPPQEVPRWDPANVLEVLEELSDLDDAAPWIRETYFDAARDLLHGGLHLSPEQRRRFVKILEKTTEGRAINKKVKNQPEIERWLRSESDPGPEPNR